MPLLDEIIAAHGGEERWAQIRELKLRVRVGGNILALKFQSPLTRHLEFTINTQEVRALLRPFPRTGMVGVFEADQVRIETSEGQIVAQRQIVRDAAGRVARRAIWGDLDVLYFLGYALWNYSVTPFVFRWPDFTCREGRVWNEPDGSRWRTLEVRYPMNFATHCREQTFYFDERGLLRRLDYTAEVISDLARGAHLCANHQTFDGLAFPTHRVVYPVVANSRPVRILSAMKGWIDDVIVS